MAYKTSGIRYTIIALVAFMALITGLFVSQYLHKGPNVDPETFHGTWLQHPRAINEFHLTGTNGNIFDNKSLKGQWTFMFFGFTSCGYMCPTTMAELGKTYRLLVEKNIQPLPKIVMVSIDPSRDTLQKIDNYVHAFNMNFYGARGSSSVVQRMTKEMGVVFTKVSAPEGQDKNNYDIQHSGAVMVFNPKGELNAFFTAPHKSENIASDYISIVG